MSIISKLNLTRLKTPFNSFPFPFICFTLPQEGFLTFSHEVSHLLQFKRSETSRWSKEGKFIFYTEKEAHYKPRRECETEVIEYKLNKLYSSDYLTDSFFRETKGSKRDTYYLNARKKYTKRLLKQRAYYINKYLDNNMDFVRQHQEALIKIHHYLNVLDTSTVLYQILKQRYNNINNSKVETFNLYLSEYNINILNECLVPYTIKENLVYIII